MDDMIATALREHADGDIHVERLLDSVRAGVRRQRRRRFAASCGAAVVAVGLVAVAGVAALPDRRPDAVTGPPPPVAFPRPPAADGPTAAEAPEVLGSGPALFHLDVTGLIGWRFAAWAAGHKFEELSVDAAEVGGFAQITAARDPIWLGPWGTGVMPATVNGLPAETAEQSGSHAVRWQPRTGIWVQVLAGGEPANAIAVAEKVRLDRVYRCAVPFRLPGYAPPPPSKCATDFTLDDAGLSATAAGTVWMTPVPGGPEYQVSVGRAKADTVVNDTIAGKPVQVVPAPADASAPPEIRYPYDGRMAYFWQFGNGPAEALRAVAAAFTPVPGSDPDSWPNTPFDR
jgi:hypothetical protein